MACPFCDSTLFKTACYPLNFYNDKIFEYVKCRDCGLVYLKNFPDKKDFELMYPPSYQRNEAETSIQNDPYIKLYGLRFSYGYQFDIIKTQIGDTASILDYGCGTGHFLGNAVHYGFGCDGAEFNSEYLDILKTSFGSSNFFTIAQVLSESFTKKYDVIRLSNVLEHLTDPKQVIQKLKNLLNPGGILLIEGPIEDNFSIAEMFRKIYFCLGKFFLPNRRVTFPPYHIFFSNTRNQLRFFSDCGFDTIHFETSEEAWPFPSSIKEAKGFVAKISALVARVSMMATNVTGNKWGNIFVYCGKIKSK